MGFLYLKYNKEFDFYAIKMVVEDSSRFAEVSRELDLVH